MGEITEFFDDRRVAIAAGEVLPMETRADALRCLVDSFHGVARRGGWWTNLDTGEDLDRDPVQLLALMNSELNEAFEGDRKNLMDDHLPDRPMREVELADFQIRAFDMVGGLGLTEEFISVCVSFGEVVDEIKLHSDKFYRVLFDLQKIVTSYEEGSGQESSELAELLASAVMASFVVGKGFGLDLPGALAAKGAYNVQREDHRLEKRREKNGKKF